MTPEEKWKIAFVVITAIFVLLLLGLLITFIILNYNPPEIYDGIFRLPEHDISHLGVTQVGILVHTVYSSQTAFTKIPTYDDIKKTVTTIRAAPGFQADQPWQAVAKDIGEHLWEQFDFIGISVEIFVPVESDPSPESTSCATFSKGAVERLIRLDITS